MEISLQIESWALGGEGVAHHDGRAVFVERAFPGERVRVRLDPSKRVWRGPLLEIEAASPERIAPDCPHESVCGGCAWLALSRPAQERAKTELFRETLRRLGDPSFGEGARPLVSSPAPERYRERATFHLRGRELGFRASSSHDFVPIASCRLLHPTLDAARQRLQDASRALGSPPGTDVALASSGEGDRVAAAFFVPALTTAAKTRAEKLMAAARLSGAVLVAGQRTQLVGRHPVLTDGPLFRRPDLFFQANGGANRALVAALLERTAGARRILELYSGAGNFTLPLAGLGAEVTAVEVVGPSLDLARRSADRLPSRPRFIQGDSLEVARALAKQGERYDLLVLDPPRAGAPGIAGVARGLEVPRILYVSCDPATLARDARALREEGYRLVEATPFDLFPRTPHIEGLALFERS